MLSVWSSLPSATTNRHESLTASDAFRRYHCQGRRRRSRPAPWRCEVAVGVRTRHRTIVGLHRVSAWAVADTGARNVRTLPRASPNNRALVPSAKPMTCPEQVGAVVVALSRPRWVRGRRCRRRHVALSSRWRKSPIAGTGRRGWEARAPQRTNTGPTQDQHSNLT